MSDDETASISTDSCLHENFRIFAYASGLFYHKTSESERERWREKKIREEKSYR